MAPIATTTALAASLSAGQSVEVGDGVVLRVAYVHYYYGGGVRVWYVVGDALEGVHYAHGAQVVRALDMRELREALTA